MVARVSQRVSTHEGTRGAVGGRLALSHTYRDVLFGAGADCPYIVPMGTAFLVLKCTSRALM